MTTERTEEVVSQIMRTARDEKIRLDTVVAENTQRIAGLIIENGELAVERDQYLKRATQLETDLRAMIAILNDALSTNQRSISNPSFPRYDPSKHEGVGGETLSTPAFGVGRDPNPSRGLPSKRPYD